MRQGIFNELMQLKRDSKINTVFTKDGTVFVVISREGRPRLLRSNTVLERLSQQLAESAINLFVLKATRI